jgi:hypothetical protein
MFCPLSSFANMECAAVVICKCYLGHNRYCLNYEKFGCQCNRNSLNKRVQSICIDSGCCELDHVGSEGN